MRYKPYDGRPFPLLPKLFVMILAPLFRSCSWLSRTAQNVLQQPLTAALIIATALTACTTTHQPKESAFPPSEQESMAQLNAYKIKIAQRILDQNAPLLASGNPQSMLRSVVVMAFKVDKQGQLTSWSVYRTNGDAQAEQRALSSLQRAAPLPLPPSSLFGNAREIEIVEGWLFNDDGRFQIRTLASPQK